MRKFKKIIIILLLLYILLQIIINYNNIHHIIYFSYKIFIENIIPNLLPFLIISSLLINYGFVDICYKIFNPIMNKLFRIDGNAAFVFIMSLLTGFPSNSKYTKDLLTNNKISLKNATKILTFTHFSNPLFVIGTVSNLIDFKTSLIILFSHYAGNIIIGLLFRNLFIDYSKNELIKTKEEPFGKALLKGVRNSIDTLLLIFGTMTFFLIITNIISSLFMLPPIIKFLLSRFLEFIQGITYAGLLSIEHKYKATLMGIFISFGGLSVHAQILSVISDTEIPYKPFFIARLIHSVITGFLVYVLI